MTLICFVAIFLSGIGCLVCGRNLDYVGVAIGQIIDKIHIPLSRKVEVIVATSKNKNLFDKTLETILTGRNESFPVSLYHYNSRNINNDAFNFGFADSVIFIAESEADFARALNQRYALGDALTVREFLIYIKHWSQESYALIEQLKDVNSYFLFNEGINCIKLITVKQFTSEGCNKPKIIDVNRFSNQELAWKSDRFIIEKFKNFCGCDIEALTPSGYDSVQKYVTKIVQDVSKVLNFTVKPTVLGTESFEKFSFMSCELSMNTEFPYTIVQEPYFYNPVVFLIPPGEPYTDVEKMFLMFDIYVWMYLVSTFVIAIFVIQIINKTPKFVQYFVYGRGITTPTMNMIAAFMGIGQQKLPERNSARILLITFIFFSLVIRTCYQSTLFTFLQSTNTKKEVQTINELIENNFTFVIEYNFYKSIKEMNFLKR